MKKIESDNETRILTKMSNAERINITISWAESPYKSGKVVQTSGATSPVAASNAKACILKVMRECQN